MAISNDERQYPLADFVRLQRSDLPTGTDVKVSHVPGAGTVISGELVVVTAWNTTGTATLDLGDATTADRYLAAVDLKTPGRTAFTVDGTVYDEFTDLIANATLADGDGEEGEAYIVYSIVREYSAHEVL